MRDRDSFTLIELLIVVVIIGIPASIAIPKFSSTREKAYFAAMKSDLKNLASQQEIYYSDTYEYTNVVVSLSHVSSSGVNSTIIGGTDGWSATVTHAALRPTDARSTTAMRPPSASELPFRSARAIWPARSNRSPAACRIAAATGYLPRHAHPTLRTSRHSGGRLFGRLGEKRSRRRSGSKR